MNAKELLKDRFEIIANYPDNDFGDVGDILDRNWCKYPNGNEQETPIWSISDFPNIFKKLEWWEKRKIEDMPMYLKQTGMVDCFNNPIPDRYLKVKKHWTMGNGEWRDDLCSVFCIEKNTEGLGYYFGYSDYEPIDEDEYLSWLNKKQLNP